MSTHREICCEGGPHDGETHVIDDRLEYWDPDPDGDVWAGVYEPSAYPPVWIWIDDGGAS